MLKRIHCQEEFERDIKSVNFAMLNDWFVEDYSTSKHLLIIHSIVRALNMKKIGEIGFGRSTIVLGFTAYLNMTKHIVCDRYDFSKYIDRKTRYIHGNSEKFFSDPEVKSGMDFIMMDYFSSRKIDKLFCYKEIKRAFKVIKQNGFIVIHDTIEDRYNAKDAVKMFKKKYSKEAEILTLPFGFGLTLIKRLSKSKFGKLKPISIKKKDK